MFIETVWDSFVVYMLLIKGAQLIVITEVRTEQK